MTEQEKTSAVVEETREAVDTTSQPVATEKKSKNNTALILSAVAIAIALAAGVGLYGWGKQQAVNQTATSDALANQLTALQKAQESQKAELEGIIKQQAAQLKQANRQQETLATNGKVQEAYINFLRGMFKGTEPTKYIQLAYLTGILPVKKEKTQSALNNFDEFTMLSASNLAPYIGFTEDEVEKLSKEYHQDFDKVKRWYDGYLLKDYQIYNPRAVVGVMLKGEFKSYWSETASYEAVTPLINMNYDGLKTAIIEMLSGANVKVDTATFKNDTVNIHSKDDVLTYMIHLGYLGYDQYTKTAFIPNEEIRQELTVAVESRSWNEMLMFQQESERLLDATLDMDGVMVGTQIEKIHNEYISVIQYHNENSLSSVLTIAYLSAMQYYFKPIRKLPTGRGFADFVYIPKPEYKADYPALIVELKWNQNAQTAMQQIKNKKYPTAIENYTGDILLVGISYDKNCKEHQCLIEKYEKES